MYAKFGELPKGIQNLVKWDLRLYDSCTVYFENGEYLQFVLNLLQISEKKQKNRMPKIMVEIPNIRQLVSVT